MFGNLFSWAFSQHVQCCLYDRLYSVNFDKRFFEFTGFQGKLGLRKRRLCSLLFLDLLQLHRSFSSIQM